MHLIYLRCPMIGVLKGSGWDLTAPSCAIGAFVKNADSYSDESNIA